MGIYGNYKTADEYNSANSLIATDPGYKKTPAGPAIPSTPEQQRRRDLKKEGVISRKKAELTRKDYADYKKRFKPREDKLIGDINDRSFLAGAASGRASGYVNNAFSSAQGQLQRRTARYGGMTADQSRQSQMAMRLNKTKSDAYLGQKTNQMTRDRLRATQESLIDMGRKQKQASSGAMGQAAGLESQRENANKIAQEQKTAQNRQTALSIAAIAAMAM
jgi:hypothetical protein